MDKLAGPVGEISPIGMEIFPYSKTHLKFIGKIQKKYIFNECLYTVIKISLDLHKL